MQSSVLYCEKANNYLNIKEKKLNIYFQIVLIVSQRSLRTEFTNTFFSLLPQSKGVFLQLARDWTVCGCGLPYYWCTLINVPQGHWCFLCLAAFGIFFLPFLTYSLVWHLIRHLYLVICHGQSLMGTGGNISLLGLLSKSKESQNFYKTL